MVDRVEALVRERSAGAPGDARAGEAPSLACVPACDGTITLAAIERTAVVATLERCGGHRQRTAEALGIGVRTLGMKLRAWKEAGLISAAC
ncbi:MAG: helix-turn-helix domain-containing protein [Phycisphaerae bacterium]|nr:helix-turn-helix domain-containing protein [Phycisphaerae bacterium]